MTIGKKTISEDALLSLISGLGTKLMDANASLFYKALNDRLSS